MQESELLAPAGDFETALAAFAAGADAVYCGLNEFSARAFATNFSMEDLKRLISYARVKGKKVYVTFNTVLDESDIEDAVRMLADLEEVGPDALIVQDLGIAKICRDYFPGLVLHASTQLVAHNLEGVLALKEFGFKRVVLARELSLEEIGAIAKRCGGLELEAFIHGALCYSISGLCLFSAMEKGRSGNRGKCAYCCRLAYPDGEGKKVLAFSMKDLRLGEDVRKLVDAGVVSLKIEGRMKSALYVASVTKYYRQILDRTESGAGAVTVADLETVFSRRTTELYLNGRPGTKGVESPIDAESLGHLGTAIGVVKHVTRDREGRAWLRFHTARALEKHDGLQFAAPDGGKPLGLGISEMRTTISRVPVFEVSAGTDVEILLPENDEVDLAGVLKAGQTVYCSMSNEVKRRFPMPSFRPSEYPGPIEIEVEVTLEATRMVAKACGVEVEVRGEFGAAKNPDKTFGAVRSAFEKLGETDYKLGRLVLNDEGKLFAPKSLLNDLRRDLVEALDAKRYEVKREKIARALDDDEVVTAGGEVPRKVVKIRADQNLPAGDWDEIVVAFQVEDVDRLCESEANEKARLALPVWTAEMDFNRLRIAVKHLMRAGFVKWEASDLATLRMLKELGVEDITADWTLYAFNSRALAALAKLGVKRFVASPENERENLQYLAESGYAVEFLTQQSTPLFISLTEPKEQTELAVTKRGKLWVTTKKVPREFDVPEGVATRIDLSWEAE
jgi:U32 family peptidase